MSRFAHWLYADVRKRRPQPRTESSTRAGLIALDGDGNGRLGNFVQWQSVDTDGIAPTAGDLFQQRGAPCAEVDRRRQRRDLGNASRVWQHHRRVAYRIEQSEPRVEELHRVAPAAICACR